MSHEDYMIIKRGQRGKPTVGLWERVPDLMLERDKINRLLQECQDPTSQIIDIWAKCLMVPSASIYKLVGWTKVVTQAISRRERDRDGQHGPKRHRFEAEDDLGSLQHGHMDLQSTSNEGSPATGGGNDHIAAVAPGQTAVSCNLPRSASDVPLITPQTTFFSFRSRSSNSPACQMFRQVQACPEFRHFTPYRVATKPKGAM